MNQHDRCVSVTPAVEEIINLKVEKHSFLSTISQQINGCSQEHPKKQNDKPNYLGA
jgi:hypothetical protein